MPATSLARSFFDSIVNAADPVASIRGLVNTADPTFETDWLDFKTEHRDPKQRDKKYREQLCEALSGFSNNRGGVIVWGIEAKKHLKNGVQIDAASEEKPVANPIGVKSRLIELCRQAVDPPLTNVEFEAFECPDNSGTGFVVCFVPEGEFKPYRTDEGRDSQFYLRAVDSFFVMSRSIIQSMLYPRLKALFKIRLSLTRKTIRNPERVPGRPLKAIARWQVELFNLGSATAKDVGLKMTSSVKMSNFSEASHWWGGAEIWRAKFPIHPDTSVLLAKFEHEPCPVSNSSFSDSPVRFSFQIFCENHERQLIEMEMPLEGRWSQIEEETVEMESVATI